MTNSTIGKKQYMLIGKMLVSRYPDIADKFIGELNVEPPKEKDLSRLRFYFRDFCNYQCIQPAQYIGRLKNSYKVEIRRLFVSVMLHFYSPNSFCQPSDLITVPRGFGRAMSEVLDLSLVHTFRIVREVIFMEKVYQDYRERVDAIVGQLMLKSIA